MFLAVAGIRGYVKLLGDRSKGSRGAVGGSGHIAGYSGLFAVSRITKRIGARLKKSCPESCPVRIRLMYAVYLYGAQGHD